MKAPAYHLHKAVITLAIGLLLNVTSAAQPAVPASDVARSASLGAATTTTRPALRGSVVAFKPAPPSTPAEQPSDGAPQRDRSDQKGQPPAQDLAVVARAESAANDPDLAAAQGTRTDAPIKPSTLAVPAYTEKVSAPTAAPPTMPAPWPASMPQPGRGTPPVAQVQATPSAAPLAPLAPAVVVEAPSAPQARPRTASPSVPQIQTHLPGVGTIAGAKRLAPNTVRVSENTVEEVMVSSAFPNRISTPFANPRVIDSSGSDITKDGSSVYIKPLGSAPVAIFITGDRPGDPVVSLLLKPTEVGPQTVVLQLDERQRQSAPIESVADASQTTPLPYSARLADVIKQVAVGSVPRGLSGGPVPYSVGRMGDLMLRTESRYSGSDLEVYTYWVTNISKQEIVLDESMFYTSDEVRAVAFFPVTDLPPSGETRVIVVARVQTEGY